MDFDGECGVFAPHRAKRNESVDRGAIDVGSNPWNPGGARRVYRNEPITIRQADNAEERQKDLEEGV